MDKKVDLMSLFEVTVDFYPIYLFIIYEIFLLDPVLTSNYYLTRPLRNNYRFYQLKLYLISVLLSVSKSKSK